MLARSKGAPIGSRNGRQADWQSRSSLGVASEAVPGQEVLPAQSGDRCVQVLRPYAPLSCLSDPCTVPARAVFAAIVPPRKRRHISADEDSPSGLKPLSRASGTSLPACLWAALHSKHHRRGSLEQPFGSALVPGKETPVAPSCGALHGARKSSPAPLRCKAISKNFKQRVEGLLRSCT